MAEKAACANPECGRICRSAALSLKHLCYGCEYLGKVTVNRILKRVSAEPIRRPRQQAHKAVRRRNSFRKGATA
jgi:hypothetical protein